MVVYSLRAPEPQFVEQSSNIGDAIGKPGDGVEDTETTTVPLPPDLGDTAGALHPPTHHYKLMICKYEDGRLKQVNNHTHPSILKNPTKL